MSERLIRDMEAAFARRDIDGLLALLTEDATIESYLVARFFQRKDGVTRGRAEIRELVQALMGRGVPWGGHRPPIVRGNTVAIEYFTASSDTETFSVDMIEVRDGKIHRLRAYAGWRAVMALTEQLLLRPIGTIRSELTSLADAPRQGPEGGPDAWLEVEPWAADALHGFAVGDEILVLTWFHRADRSVLQTHPRNDPNNPLTGVFATRSPDRPNPIGLHPVTIRAIEGTRLRVGPLEAIDGTPVVDLKPVL